MDNYLAAHLYTNPAQSFTVAFQCSGVGDSDVSLAARLHCACHLVAGAVVEAMLAVGMRRRSMRRCMREGLHVRHIAVGLRADERASPLL